MNKGSYTQQKEESVSMSHYKKTTTYPPPPPKYMYWYTNTYQVDQVSYDKNTHKIKLFINKTDTS